MKNRKEKASEKRKIKLEKALKKDNSLSRSVVLDGKN
jgi:hypothetical protein